MGTDAGTGFNTGSRRSEALILSLQTSAHRTTDLIIQPILERTIGMSDQLLELFQVYIMAIKGSAKKMLVYSILRILAKATTSTPISSEASDKTVAAAAALICSASKRDEEFVNILLQWLSSDGLVQDLSIRRAVIAALAKDFGQSSLVVPKYIC